MDLRTKKYALGAANTESGKSNLTIFSIAALCTAVKREARRNAD